MLLLALMVAGWMVFGAGRQVGHDARVGMRNARQHARDWAAAKWQAAPAPVRKTGGVLAATGRAGYRAARRVGHSIADGARAGREEGRRRHAEHLELRAAQAEIDELADRERQQGITHETPEYAEAHRRYYEIRDRHRARRRGEPVAVIADPPTPDQPAEPTGPDPDDVPQPRKPERPPAGGPVPTNTPTPTVIDGEAMNIDGARTAWARFEGHAVEQLESAGAVEQDAKQRATAAAAMLESAQAVETDARAQIAAADTLAGSLAAADMDAQSVADAQTQQEHASGLLAVARELRISAETAQAQAANDLQLAQRLRGLAETAQAHAAAAAAGMTSRHALMEEAVNSTPHAAQRDFYQHH